MTLTIRLIPAEVFEKCKIDAEGMWADEKPKKWYYVIPIVLIWILVVWLVAKAII